MKRLFALFLFCSLYSFADTEDCLQSASSAIHYWPNTENTSAPPRVLRVKEIILHHLEREHIAYTNHAMERMEERSISKDAVKQTLREGVHLNEEDFFDNDYNDWLYFITDDATEPSPSKIPLRIAVSLRHIHTNEPRIVVVSAMIKDPSPTPQRIPEYIQEIREQRPHPVSSSTMHYWPNTENTSTPPRVYRVKDIILHHLEKRHITYTKHARDQMKEQVISEDDVKRALKQGVHLVQEDFFDHRNNDWLYSVTYNVEGKPLMRTTVSLRHIHTNEPRVVVVSATIENPSPTPQSIPEPEYIREIREQYQHPASPTMYDYWPNTENTLAPPRFLHIREIILHHLERGHIFYTKHASDQMKEQAISKDAVQQTLIEGTHFTKDDILDHRHNDWHYYITDIKRPSLATKPLKISLSLRHILADEPRIIVVSAIINLPPKNLRKAPKNRSEQRQRKKKNLRKKITHYDEDDYDEDDY